MATEFLKLIEPATFNGCPFCGAAPALIVRDTMPTMHFMVVCQNRNCNINPRLECSAFREEEGIRDIAKVWNKRRDETGRLSVEAIDEKDPWSGVYRVHASLLGPWDFAPVRDGPDL